MMRWISIAVVLGLGQSDAFAPPRSSSARSSSPLILSGADTASETDDILKPKYDIEPIPLRIGHGFDIHRMAPLEEAGQPVVIGGVTIPHKDQKVR
mmetsp:Transcript_10597/g.21379  ORF Transcript_10597/g.21379 Transcript_10597/m.21379 type:complete len:96 (+) Transcript_10597:1918-2205(+)